jgi:hypothetical protein
MESLTSNPKLENSLSHERTFRLFTGAAEYPSTDNVREHQHRHPKGEHRAKPIAPGPHRLEKISASVISSIGM